MKKTEHQLSFYFNDPKFGLLSQEKFYRKVKLKLPNITRKEVKEFYKNQSAVQINTLKKRQKVFHHIIAPSVGSFQADLLDMVKYKGTNNNYKYILTFIDIYSRRAWAYPLKGKFSKNVFHPMSKWINSVKRDLHKLRNLTTAKEIEFYDLKIRNLTTDNGGEFKDDVGILMEDNNIKHWTHNVGDHSVLGVNDRFHRTLRELINKYFALKDTTRWIDVLPDLIENYNTTEHHGINATPALVYSGEELPEIELNTALSQKRNSIKVGDFVRVRKEKTKFSNGGNNWSKTIHEVLEQIGHKYIVGGISLKLKPEDLLKVDKIPKGQSVLKAKNVDKIKDLFPDKPKRDLKLEREHKSLDIQKSNIIRRKRKGVKNSKYFGKEFAN